MAAPRRPHRTPHLLAVAGLTLAAAIVAQPLAAPSAVRAEELAHDGQFSVSPDQDRIGWTGWAGIQHYPGDREVTVTVDHVDTPDNPDAVRVVTTDAEGRWDITDVEVHATDVVHTSTAPDPGSGLPDTAERELVVIALTIDGHDTDTGEVWGRSDHPGGGLQICVGTSPTHNLCMNEWFGDGDPWSPTDPGRWSYTFPAGYVVDGAGIAATQLDDDGDLTEVSTILPYFMVDQRVLVIPSIDVVAGEWPGEPGPDPAPPPPPLTITVHRGDSSQVFTYTPPDDLAWDNGACRLPGVSIPMTHPYYWCVATDGWDLVPGDVVEVTDGELTVTSVVQDLALFGALVATDDVLGGTATGADPGPTVRVDAIVGDGTERAVRYVQGSGWTAGLGTAAAPCPTDWPGNVDCGTVDLRPTFGDPSTNTQIRAAASGGGGSTVEFTTLTALTAFLEPGTTPDDANLLRAVGLPTTGEASIHVTDGVGGEHSFTTPLEPTSWAGVPGNGGGFLADPAPWVLGPGDSVTVSVTTAAGTIVSQLGVADVQVHGVDVGADTVTGWTGGAGPVLVVAPIAGPPGQAVRLVDAGDFVADFGDEPSPPSYGTADLQYGTTGWIAQFDGDGDATRHAWTAWAPMTLDVTHDVGLTDGEEIGVGASGLTPYTAAFVSVNVASDPTNQFQVLARPVVGDGGTIGLSVHVPRWIGGTDCADAPGTCILVVADEPDPFGRNLSVPLTFARLDLYRYTPDDPDDPMSGSGAVGDPITEIDQVAHGEWIWVEGSGFDPGQQGFGLNLCSDVDGHEWCRNTWSSQQWVVIDGAGEFEHALQVGRNVFGPYGDRPGWTANPTTNLRDGQTIAVAATGLPTDPDGADCGPGECWIDARQDWPGGSVVRSTALTFSGDPVPVGAYVTQALEQQLQGIIHLDPLEAARVDVTWNHDTGTFLGTFTVARWLTPEDDEPFSPPPVEAGQYDCADSLPFDPASGAVESVHCSLFFAVVEVVGDGAGGTYEMSALEHWLPTHFTRLDPPGVPRELTAKRGDRQVTLTWLAPLSNGGSPITDYVIQKSPDGGVTWTTVNDGVSTARTSTVTGLTNGKTYAFRVAAKNAIGRGPFTPKVSATPATTPTAPRELTAAPGNRTVTLKWLAPLSTGGLPIKDYVIQKSPDGGVTWVTVNDGVSTVRSYTVSGLTNGKPYAFRVAAKNAVGRGPFTPKVSATPRA